MSKMRKLIREAKEVRKDVEDTADELAELISQLKEIAVKGAEPVTILEDYLDDMNALSSHLHDMGLAWKGEMHREELAHEFTTVKGRTAYLKHNAGNVKTKGGGVLTDEEIAEITVATRAAFKEATSAARAGSLGFEDGMDLYSFISTMEDAIHQFFDMDLLSDSTKELLEKQDMEFELMDNLQIIVNLELKV